MTRLPHMMTAWLCLITCCLAAAPLPPVVADADARKLGAFALAPAATLYLVVGEEPVTARVAIHRGHRQEGDLLSIRAFDAEENLSFWQSVQVGQLRDTYGPGDMEVWGIPLQIPVQPQRGELLLEVDIPLQGAGVHQIRLMAGARNSIATVTLSEARPYGVSFQNGWFTPWNPALTEVYAFVPPHAEELQLSGGGVEVFDHQRQPLLAMQDAPSGQPQNVPVTQTEVVWPLVFRDPDRFKFRAAGFPLILCPTPEAARAIRASVEQLPDGTVVTHRFQKRIAELLPTLLAPERIGQTEDLVAPLAERREAWLTDPRQGITLLRALAPVNAWLEGQNLDPMSHWSGAMGPTWSQVIDRPGAEGRWDRLRSLRGQMYAGVSPNNRAATLLAYAALIDDPANPYQGRKELLYRAAAACLRDLMTLGEDETWRGVGADMTDYAGMMAFAVGQKTFPPYRLIAPHMPPDVRAVWTEGLQRIVDRLYPEQMVTCRNQSSHYLEAFEAFAQGSELARYHDLSRAYARRFAASAHPAGYQIEQCGPDGSYIGMTHWHQAVYYQMSGDTDHLEAIRRSYHFFNHTVAPEPDGRMLGSFNFNHRIGDGFHNEQWGGAKGILDSVLPEVGLWATPQQQEEATRRQNAQSLGRMLDRPAAIQASSLGLPRYLHRAAPDRSGRFPALEKASFVRAIGDELVAVRQPGYYALVYVGKPAPHRHYISGREAFRQPLPEEAESRGGEPNLRQVTPYLGGGLSSFWTPDYGHALLATNWSPLTHHGVVARTEAGDRYWADYFATEYQLDPQARELRVHGRIEQQPLRYERHYHFGAEAITLTLTLTATAPLTLAGLIENVPLAMGPVKSAGVQASAGEITRGPARADHLTLQHGADAQVLLQLDQAHDLHLEPSGMQRRGLQVGRVEIQLPRTWQAGETHTLRYQLIPASADASTDAAR